MTFYVGASRDWKRRLREHKKVLGYRPALIVIETGHGSFNEAERKWISEYRAMGCPLVNQTDGGNGCWTHSTETRRLLSLQGKGKRKPAGFGEMLSALTKGQPRNWTPEGEERVKSGQFKPGHQRSEATVRACAAASRARWATIPKEERTRMAVERNRKMWTTRRRAAR